MMNGNMLKVALVSSIMIMSSLAGCLSDDVVDEIDDIIDPITEPEPILEEPEIYGKVMVSTYHVGELVKAVGGENIHVDYMSQDTYRFMTTSPRRQISSGLLNQTFSFITAWA